MSAQRSRFLFACIALDINFQPHIRHWVSCPYILVPNNACNLRRKCVHLNLLEETLMLGRLRARGEGGDTGWDGWMASPTWWTWVWASSGSWWWTGRPGVLQSMGSQRVGHDWSILAWHDMRNLLITSDILIWTQIRLLIYQHFPPSNSTNYYRTCYN